MSPEALPSFCMLAHGGKSPVLNWCWCPTNNGNKSSKDSVGDDSRVACVDPDPCSSVVIAVVGS